MTVAIAEEKVRTADEDLRIAAHEAGHAIAGWFNGRSIKLVTIEPKMSEDGRLLNGHVIYGAPLEDWNDDLFARIVENVAGAAAERLHSVTTKPLKCSDKSRAYESASALVVSDQAMEVLVAAAEIEAEHILREHYPTLVAVASELVRCRTMDGATAQAFVERCDHDARRGASTARVFGATNS